MRNNSDNPNSFCKEPHSSFNNSRCFQFQWCVLFMACLWFITANVTADQIYVWEDNNGVLHFGDSVAVNLSAAFSQQVDGAFSTVSYIVKSSTSVKQTTQHQSSSVMPGDNPGAGEIKNRVLPYLSSDPINLRDAHYQYTGAHPAIRSLLEVASKHIETGQLERAAAVVERALRLQADDPELWYYLA